MDPLQERIDAARSLIRAAERELDAALRSVEVRPRAEKTTISQAVEGALGRLRAAKESLTALKTDDSPDEDENAEGLEGSAGAEASEAPAKGSAG
ncbi:MAG TPA: hypothetical protein VFS43_11190 [Polyangiaceae bacterium]|nr:hypothetical protein [Polyangiaceae bacterium]